MGRAEQPAAIWLRDELRDNPKALHQWGLHCYTHVDNTQGRKLYI